MQVCVCVCADKCHCLPSVHFMLLNNVKSFNETMIYLSSLLIFRESRMHPIYWDHYHRQWDIIYHEFPVIKEEECIQWMNRPHLFMSSLSVLCSRPWPHGTKCSQKVILRGKTVSFFSTLYDKDRKVKREEASFSLNTAKSDGGEKEMMETVVQQEWTEGWLWISVKSTLVLVEIGSPVVFLLPSGVDGVKTTAFLL